MFHSNRCPLTWSAGFAASLAACVLGTAPALAAGEVVTVTTLEDRVDFGGAQQITDLPGPDGVVSFREAVMAVNNTAGAQTVKFAIPQSEWWLLSGVALLKLENDLFHVTDNATTLDFSSQVDFTGDTNPNGCEVGVYGLEPNGWGVTAILIGADDCTVIGLGPVMQRGYGVDIRGNNNRVIGCSISGPLHGGVRITGGFEGPPASNNVIGGTEPGEGNFLSGGSAGLRLEAPAENNIAIGNHMTGGSMGVWIIGSPYSTTVKYNRIGGPTAAERNVINGAGSYCCEGSPSGAQISIEYGLGNVIEGNYIGITADGAAGVNQRGPRGINVVNSNDTVIRNNIIGAIRAVGTNHFAGQLFGVGIAVTGDSANTVIQGNVIGADPTGAIPIPNLQGVTISPQSGGLIPSNVTFGGVEPSEGNIVAFSERTGMWVSSGSQGVRISGSAFYQNGLLGIDLLGSTGVTPNDPGDSDSGPNGLQNFPVLTAASAGGGTITIDGMLDSTANSTFDVEFFANAACDPSGHGEGERFLGWITVSTNAQGIANFSATLPQSVADGSFITATATNALTNGTSEFSACRIVQASTGMPGDLNCDGIVTPGDISGFVMALTSPEEYALSHPQCDAMNADTNGDGAVTPGDIASFVALLTGS